MSVKTTIKPTYKLLNKKSGKSQEVTDGTVAKFLHKHLEQYGDEVEAIQKAINYIFDNTGGNLVIQFIDGQISGAVVFNETGMADYIPENILVYIAMDSKYRGQGLGLELLKNAIKVCDGDIALHVEKDNPARFLYEKIGFTNPYLEMRLKRPKF